MSSRIIKNIFAFLPATIFLISLIISNNSCSKEANQTPVKKAGPPPPDSKIIYTDVNPDLAILLASNSFNLDLNNDGIVDFVINKFSRSTACVSRNDPRYNSSDYFCISIEPSDTSNAIMTDDGSLPLSLNDSSAIQADSLWENYGLLLLFATGRATSCFPVTGAGSYWLNVSDKYLGLKFITGNNTYYGWARLSSSYTLSNGYTVTAGQLILKDYAYNSIPNQQIIAGQTK
jgi:hypothetical protein